MTRERFLERQNPLTIISNKDTITVRICVNQNVVMENGKKYYEYDCNSFTDKLIYIDTTLLLTNPKAFLDYERNSTEP